MSMYKLDINEISERVRRYKLEQILNSGENDMFDDKIDRKKIEEVLNQSSDIDFEEAETVSNKNIDNRDLKKILTKTDEEKLYDSIINLKSFKNNVE